MYSYLLIAIMGFLLMNHFIGKFNHYSSTIEGLANNAGFQGYQDEKDPTILATKNAANISYLKDRIDGLDNLKQMVDKLDKEVKQNTKSITDMVTANAEKAKSINEAVN
jgi:hypothetical protein